MSTIPPPKTPTLPEELVKEILSPLLLIPDSKFFDMSEVSPFAIPSPSSSVYLRVCKLWMRVATPLLYNCIVVRTKAQAQAMERVLKANPSFGAFVKKLRVEGGFGTYMLTIIKATPNIVDFTFSLEVLSPDTVSGLNKGLACMKNIARVGILGAKEFGKLPGNRMVLSLVDTVAHCMEHSWTGMHTCFCAWPWENTQHAESTSRIQKALIKCPSLKTLHLVLGSGKMGLWHDTDALAANYQTLLDIVPLRKVTLASPSGGKARMEDAQLVFKVVPEIEHYTSIHPPFSQASNSQPEPIRDILPSVATFQPLKDAAIEVQDKIWGKIIFHAMDADHVYSEAELQPPPLTRTFNFTQSTNRSKQVSQPQMRIRIAMVCHRFHRLAKPYMHLNLVLDSSDKILSFSAALLRCPEIGPTIRTITLATVKTYGRDPFMDSVETSRWVATATELRSALSVHDAALRKAEITNAKDLIHRMHHNASKRLKKEFTLSNVRYLSTEVEYAHLAMEYIFLQAVGLIKLTSTVDKSVDSHRKLLLIPHWRELEKLAPALLCLDAHHAIVPTSQADISHFSHLKTFCLRPYRYPTVQDCSTFIPETVDGDECELGWEHLTYDNSVPLGDPGRVSDTIILDSLTASYSFPFLTSLYIKLPPHFAANRYDDEDFDKSLGEALERCGPTLTHVRLSAPILNTDVDVIGLCPRIHTLEFDLNFPGSSTKYSKIFRCRAPHNALKKIRISDGYIEALVSLGAVARRKLYRETLVDSYASMDFSRFPALKELQADTCCWPTTEKKDQSPGNCDIWIIISEQLMQRTGVKLTDEDGVAWIPRLRLG